MSKINKIKLSGTTYDVEDANASKAVELTQAQYDALVSSGTVDPNTFYIITDAQAGDLTNYYTKSETDDLLDGKQATLQSGTNIKTINNQSLLGSGNIDIQGGGGGKAIEAGRGISITTGETADTVSFNLPISAGTSTGSIVANDESNKATGNQSFAEGYSTSATSQGAHSEGMYSKAANKAAHAEGYYTIASGSYSHAEGNGAKASGHYSHAEGCATIASGNTSHAEGNNTIAIGDSSHAEGQNTKASGHYSHAEGSYTTASGNYSHAEGNNTIAIGNYSHAEGNNTIANNQSEHASGQYNVSNKANNTFGNSGNTLFSVGNGTSTSARHNVFEIRQNGDIYLTLNGQDVKLQDQLGGSSITVDSALDSGSTNPVENRVIYNKIDEVEQVTAAALTNLNDRLSEDEEVTARALNDLHDSISGKADTSAVTAVQESLSGYVATSAVTSAVTSGSTSVITSGGVYEQMGGLKLVKLTQSAYDALYPNYDSNTLYVIIN